MTQQAWIAFGAGAVIGGFAGFRFGMYWLPSVLGKIHAMSLRGSVKQYRRRR